MRIPKLALFLCLFLPYTAEAAMVEGFSDCEVKQLASYWGTSPKKAAKRLRKANNAGDKAIWGDLANAKYKPANCRFEETYFTPDDAAMLAQYWGYGSDVQSAKRFVEEKIATGATDFVWAALADAYNNGKIGEDKYANPDQPMLDAFWASTYHYCDARMLSEFWGIDDLSAKVAMGYKLMNNDPAELAYLQGQVAQGRALATSAGRGCTFVELSYTYDDAALLANQWHTDVSAAKTRMSDAVAHGKDGEIRQALALARQSQPPLPR